MIRVGSVPMLSLSRIRLPRLNSRFSTSPARRTTVTLFSAKDATVYPRYSACANVDEAIFVNLSWRVNEGDAYTILGSTSSALRSHLIGLLLNQYRCIPPESVCYPINDDRVEGGHGIALVSFKTRLSNGMDFQDYSSRYYCIRDEEKLTVREHLLQAMRGDEEEGLLESTAKSLDMHSFLDLPLITLSNGQSRRERIARALLGQPKLLILEEPFTGLDVVSRATLATLLARLHTSRSPRILLVLRSQDILQLPDFISHLALVGEKRGEIQIGTREAILATAEGRKILDDVKLRSTTLRKSVESFGERKVLVQLNKVSVSYQDRKVLVDVDWQIKQGDRLVLRGHNGSGKSTLLSLILGDHPMSFTQDIEMFGRPRARVATSQIQEKIGHVSPEIAAAFPRHIEGLSVRQAIATGFDAIFCYRPLSVEREQHLDAFLRRFNFPLLTDEFLGRYFASCTHGEQSLILLLRALCKDRVPLLILDEPFAGMDSAMITHVKKYLDEELDPIQAAVIISHYEDEIPDSFVDQGIELDKGRIISRKDV